MKWIGLIAIVVLVVVVVWWWVKRARQISPQEAAAYLQNGALVIDVRSRGEFEARHLTCAINLPLGEIEEEVKRRGIDPQQVLLLHCQSGMRSDAALKPLRAMGYDKVFNLGSFANARRIVDQAGVQ